MICSKKYVFNNFHVEPVVLIGEGDYNLNDLKEIKATDSYIGMDKEVRDCQYKESFYNCTTRQHLATYQEKCGCMPLNIKLGDKVRK